MLYWLQIVIQHFNGDHLDSMNYHGIKLHFFMIQPITEWLCYPENSKWRFMKTKINRSLHFNAKERKNEEQSGLSITSWHYHLPDQNTYVWSYVHPHTLVDTPKMCCMVKKQINLTVAKSTTLFMHRFSELQSINKLI